jgi:hypothetical protein
MRARTGQAIAHPLKSHLAHRETLEIKTDQDTLDALAEAQESVRTGDVAYGPEAVRALVRDRPDR